MPLTITPPDVSAASLLAAQLPSVSAQGGAGSAENQALQVLPGAVDMMQLFQVRVKFRGFVFVGKGVVYQNRSYRRVDNLSTFGRVLC